MPRPPGKRYKARQRHRAKRHNKWRGAEGHQRMTEDARYTTRNDRMLRERKEAARARSEGPAEGGEDDDAA